MHKPSIAALVATVLSACGPGGGGSDGGTAGKCSSSVPAASTSCELAANATLPTPRTNGAVVSVGTDVVVVAGQSTGGTRAQDLVAGDASGGSITAWKSAGALPEMRSNPAVAAVGDKIYVFGGEPGVAEGSLDTSSDAFVGARGADGAYAFTSQAQLPATRTQATAAATKGAIYLLGGRAARSAPDDTSAIVAFLDADGKITSYESTTPLPAARGRATAAVVGSRLFLAGGLFPGSDKSCAASTVISSAIDASGRLGPWTDGTSLPKAPSGAVLVASGNNLYLVGGTSSYGDPAGSVLSSTVDADGVLSQWKRVATLKDLRYGHGAAVVGTHLFVVGGTADYVTSDSFAASVSSSGTVACK